MGVVSGQLKTYEMYQGEDLKIAELIQRRRLQLLVHSCIYYRLNQNQVSDRQWDLWAKELVQLQRDYPDIAKNTELAQEFADWDGTTGEFLPIDRPGVMSLAKWLIGYSETKKPQPVAKKKNAPKARLF